MTTNRRNAVVFVVIGVLMLALYHVNTPGPKPRIGEWREQMRPYTDEFLTLLQEGDIDTLHEKYCRRSTLDRKTMAGLIANSLDELGRVVSFEFKHATPMGGAGYNKTMIMEYEMAFGSGRSHKASFHIPIDAGTFLPTPGRLERFMIRGKYGKTYLDLYLTDISKNNPRARDSARQQETTVDGGRMPFFHALSAEKWELVKEKVRMRLS